ncbi:MAG: hypothetical protein KDN19_16980, partial [Verrucomicrobiae bacterium]|nr:hypothetical protein [Verrucomicrobiae bacterium]
PGFSARVSTCGGRPRVITEQGMIGDPTLSNPSTPPEQSLLTRYSTDSASFWLLTTTESESIV